MLLGNQNKEQTMLYEIAGALLLPTLVICVDKYLLISNLFKKMTMSFKYLDKVTYAKWVTYYFF